VSITINITFMLTLILTIGFDCPSIVSPRFDVNYSVQYWHVSIKHACLLVTMSQILTVKLFEPDHGPISL